MSCIAFIHCPKVSAMSSSKYTLSKAHDFTLNPRYSRCNTIITITITNGALVHRGGRKNSIPAIRHDTLRGRRKGDPQHKSCGEKYYLSLVLYVKQYADSHGSIIFLMYVLFDELYSNFIFFVFVFLGMFWATRLKFFPTT